MFAKTRIVVTALIAALVGSATLEPLGAPSTPTRSDAATQLARGSTELDAQTLCYIVVGGKIIYYQCRAS